MAVQTPADHRRASCNRCGSFSDSDVSLSNPGKLDDEVLIFAGVIECRDAAGGLRCRLGEARSDRMR
jgi:hypothetical protein